MKEITRIHLAKVAYDIEVDAKKDIQQYITALEKYANDSELLSDIEIRITELLAERGVVAGGVITKDDVAAVRERLGEPSEFAPEGEERVIEPELVGEPRRVYRDLDGALLGGVLAGFAKFFGIDALWVRLIFIVLLFPSFGTVTVAYLLLWWVIPPARTAAEKLRMSGKPVTLASIKQLGEQAQPVVNKSARILRTMLVVCTGIMLTVTGAGALFVTGLVGIGLPFGTTEYSPFAGYVPDSPWTWTGFILMIIAGLLFASLCFVLANAVFRRQWTQRIGMMVVTMIVLGLLSFPVGVGLTQYGLWDHDRGIDALRKTTSIDLPENFKSVTSLRIGTNDELADNVSVQYIVSDENRWELEALPGIKPRFEISDDSMSATVELVRTGKTWERYAYDRQSTLKIYGPALQKIELESAVHVRYSSRDTQKTVEVMAKAAGFELEGTFDEVTVADTANVRVDLESAAIGHLTVNNQGGYVDAGVVRQLTVTQPEACPVTRGGHEDRAAVRVQAVSSGELTYNGTKRSAQTISNECGAVQIGNDEDYEERN